MRRTLIGALLLACALGNGSATAGESSSSWVFAPGRYTHDPRTGLRTTQYMPEEPIEPLPDARPFMSEYRRTRQYERGPWGVSQDTYRVENWAGEQTRGLDAEWERFNDVWQRSALSGGYNNAAGNFGFGNGFGNGFNGPGQGQPWWPGQGSGWNGGGPWNGGGGWNGGGPWNGNGGGNWNGNGGWNGGGNWNGGAGNQGGYGAGPWNGGPWGAP